MRTIRLLALALSAVLFAIPRPAVAAQGGRASVHAIVVIASTQKGPHDPKLAPYEENLRRTLGRESFRFVGEGSTVVTAGQNARLSLPGGQSFEVSLEAGKVTVHAPSADIAVPLGRTVVIAGQSAGGGGDVYATIVRAN